MWNTFKVFMEFVTILLLFYVLDFLFFCLQSCDILVSQSGIEPTPPALESLNHWTTRGVPIYCFSDSFST